MAVSIAFPFSESSDLFRVFGGFCRGRTLEEVGWDIHHRSEVVVDRSNPATTFCLAESVLLDVKSSRRHNSYLPN